MTKSLTVALPTSSFLPGLGGVEVGLHNIALRLKKRGHRPVVMVTAPHLAALRRGWSLPYEVIGFPPKIWGVLRHCPPIGFALLDAWFEWSYRRYRFNFWHCTMGWPTGVALVHYARTRRPVPHLVRCAGEDIQREPAIGYGARLNPRIDQFVRRWLPQADCLVATTDTVAAEYGALGGSDSRLFPTEALTMTKTLTSLAAVGFAGFVAFKLFTWLFLPFLAMFLGFAMMALKILLVIFVVWALFKLFKKFTASEQTETS